jgi:type II secretory pathway pseudopilin PulG
MKLTKTKAFTIVELLTVLAVIALLIGLLVPSLNMARNAARVAKQKVQFVAIDQALLAFRNDYGDYPPSVNPDPAYAGLTYCGAHMLAEALLGWDLLGFHPASAWKADGTDAAGVKVYVGNDNVNLSQRRPRYLELESANAFRTRDIISQANWGYLPPDDFFLCDSFGQKTVYVGKSKISAGMPILYFKADPSKTRFGPDPDPAGKSNIYEYEDNRDLIVAKAQDDGPNGMNLNPLSDGSWFYNALYKIMDQKIWLNGAVTGRAWPHKPDSYILISAGLDGYYGTSDDITNFGQ